MHALIYIVREPYPNFIDRFSNLWKKNFFFTDLSHNELTRIPTNALSHLSNLTALDVSYNRIHYMMPGTVYPWRNLRMLNISGNNQLDLFNLQLTFYVSFCGKMSKLRPHRYTTFIFGSGGTWPAFEKQSCLFSDGSRLPQA